MTFRHCLQKKPDPEHVPSGATYILSMLLLGRYISPYLRPAQDSHVKKLEPAIKRHLARGGTVGPR